MVRTAKGRRKRERRMNANTAKQLARLLTRLDRQQRIRKALTRQVIMCEWWLDKRIAPRSGGDAA